MSGWMTVGIAETDNCKLSGRSYYQLFVKVVRNQGKESFSMFIRIVTLLRTSEKNLSIP
jgi:hypothetical protein